MRRPRLAGLRIALFCGNYNYTRDGANLVLNRWVAHLQADRGCVVRVYSPTSARPAFAPAGTLVAARSVPIPLRADYRFALGLSRSLRADLRRFAPDLVHVATPDLLGWQAISTARRLGVPVVGSFHTRFESYLRFYGLAVLEPLATAWLRAFYRRCDRVLVPSLTFAEQMMDGRRPDRIRIWGRGVDRQLFDPGRRSAAWRRAHGFADGDVVVLFFGRLVKEKGLEAFAAALDLAATRGSRVRALVVGSGPAQGWFARRLPRAAFTGALDGLQLATAVASSDIMFNPSVTEAFGNVTLEAMASGLPIVTADIPAQRRLVTDDAGLFCRPDSAVDYARAILALANDGSLRRALGAAGRRESARYDWSEVFDRGAAVYAEAVRAGESPRRLPFHPGVSSWGAPVGGRGPCRRLHR